MKTATASPIRGPGVPGAAVLLALCLAGCSTLPGLTQSQGTAAPAPPPAPAAAAPAPAPVAAPVRPAPQGAPGSSVAGQARTFSTQLATYTAVSFDQVPGWGRDEFADSWPAFLGSCRVLTGRGAVWRELCDRARQVDAKNNMAIRGFYEREFSAYQIRDDDRRPDGVVTGYFEPEISGSRRYAPPFIYPVYGQPEDMLFLDARKVTATQRGTTVAATVEGRTVVIQSGLSIRDMGRPGLYALDLAGLTLDTLDRRVRLRVDGRRLLPYFTREEIETRGAPNAKVIAFVDNVKALYEMQIQGSGRIRLAEGETIRLAYAEQNGQPFRPTLAQSGGRAASKVRTRGGAIELDLDDGDDEDVPDGPTVIRTRGFKLAVPAVAGPVAVPGRRASGPVSGSGISDPSYVFFKEAENTQGQGGPVGAFGVPLQPGRSIAVDPRATPLGYPVYVSTRTPDANAPMQRLTIAQDTGGAIRGAVRADYFFGNGQQAASQARRMKQRGQLWILLPRGLAVAGTTGTGGIRTRGGSVGGDLPQCLVPAEGSCVDD